jgi:hypothetical protein
MTKAIKSLIFFVALFSCWSSVEAQQPPFKVMSAADEPTIAGRTVGLDAQGKLLPWPMPKDTGYSYSSHVLSQWTILWDQHNRQRLHYYYCCFDFDRTTFEMMPDRYWANSTGYLRAMLEGFIERLYPYTGDARTLTFLQDFVDYELANGLTPEGYAWAQVPYASANPGDLRYTGWSFHGEDYVEPHVVGADGYAYLRLYEITGNTKYLRAAIRCADALVKNFKPGDEKNSPWPYRSYARDGKTEGQGQDPHLSNFDNPRQKPGMGPYSANVVEPIMLFDELVRLQQGDFTNYVKIRQGAADWLNKYPMQNNVWVGYFEDVTPDMANMNQVIPLEYARYILLHPEKDPDWRKHARQLIDWVKTTPKWPKYNVHGATVTMEQGNGKSFCCNLPNQCCDSHTSRLAAVEALYFAKTGDAAYKEEAFRSFNWVTYFQGLPGNAHSPFGDQWWFTDEFADGPRRLMDAFWAVPEWAPEGESHLLGSLSPVTKIAYGMGSVTYSTFDSESTDVLRLEFVPNSISAGGKPLSRLQDLAQDGYTFDESTKVLRIRHSSSKDIDIQGNSDRMPPDYLTFDDPHLAAGTALSGPYPSGLIDWGHGQWEIGTPHGKFGTFTLALTDPKAPQAEFTFYPHHVFAGIDVFNEGQCDATVTFSSPEIREISFTIKAGELRRLETGWHEPSSRVVVQLKNGQGLRFDNLAYSKERILTRTTSNLRN